MKLGGGEPWEGAGDERGVGAEPRGGVKLIRFVRDAEAATRAVAARVGSVTFEEKVFRRAGRG